MIRLSFVVPCYNVERYVGHCLDSILACGLPAEEFEVICVNDFSCDSTGAILKRYAEKYNQISVINLYQNVGYGGVRNIALREAKGVYIWFVDSDDSIVSYNVKILLRKAEHSQVDILAFNFNRLSESHDLLSTSRTFYDSPVCRGVEFVKHIMGPMFFLNIGYIWRFLYRKDFLLINKYFFPEGMCWEDTVYVPQTLLEAHLIQSTSIVGYQYYFHQTSIGRIMERQYPANLIFDYVFKAGMGLLHFAENIKDPEIKKNLSMFARNTYLYRNLMFFLLRTSGKERNSFYHLMAQNRNLVDTGLQEMNFICRIILKKSWGILVLDFISVFYKVKRRYFKRIKE